MPLDAQALTEFTGRITRFVRERLIPVEAQVAAEDRIPEDVIADMRRLGLFGMTLPARYGELELNASEEVQVVFALCCAAPAFRGHVGANNSLGGRALLWGGTEEQKNRYLPRIAAGELPTAFALTEPSTGSDAVALKTRAGRRADGCWVINGGKRYITGACDADRITVVAPTDPATQGGKGVSVFLVERGAPGMVPGKSDRKMGQQGAHTSDVYFDQCVVPPDALLGEKGNGFKLTMRAIDRGRLHIGAASVGLAPGS